MQFLLKALTRVPLPLLYTWSALVYFVGRFHLLRWRRDRAEQDIANAFPGKNADERAVILRQSYRNLADTLFEAFWGYGASADALRRRVTVENPELVTACVDAKQSVILLTAHFGNWEWLSLATGAHFGITIDVVYQPQRVEASTNSCAKHARASAVASFRARISFSIC